MQKNRALLTKKVFDLNSHFEGFSANIFIIVFVDLWNDPFHVKTSQSTKNKLNPARNENRPKNQYTPCLHESLQLSLQLYLV